MADQFDEFMEELQTDIRHEQFMGLWKKYGKIITLGAGGVVVAVALWSMWGSYQLKQQLLVSEQYVLAQGMMAEGKTQEALRQMSLITGSSHKTYALLAQFSEAALLTDGPTKDLAKAEKIYESIRQSSADRVYKDLATVQLVRVRIDELPESATTTQYEDLIHMLDPLNVKDGPWQHFSAEVKGFLLYKVGKFSEATDIFVNLAQDSKTPDSMRMRARLMAQNLTSMAGSK